MGGNECLIFNLHCTELIVLFYCYNDIIFRPPLPEAEVFKHFFDDLECLKDDV